jgi:hypothetical protein
MNQRDMTNNESKLKNGASLLVVNQILIHLYFALI